jgi:hypothetical protein
MTQREFMDEEEWAERVEMFQDPMGPSALRRVTRRNPRNQPCPTCKRPNMLTPAERATKYQCDDCARRDEGLMF